MELKKKKSSKGVFVIMPFVKTPTRDQLQLQSFFENNIKNSIEEETFINTYKVWRSGESFNITDEIIKDLFRADIVIADLSGEHPNPNVMYELGVRLSISEKPVILIREKNPKNKKVFDVDGYYTYPYDPLNYTELEKHLVEKIRRLEKGEERFESPIKKVLHDELILSQSKLSNLKPAQQREIVLQGINLVKKNISISFGPLGKGIPITDKKGSHTLAKQGYEIAKNTWSSNPLENRGIEFLTDIAQIMDQKVGDGSKIAILLASQIMESGNNALKEGYPANHIVNGMKKAVRDIISYIQNKTKLLKDQNDVVKIATTASKNNDIGETIVECIDKIGKYGTIKFKKSESVETSFEIIEGIQLERGLLSPEFATNEESASIVFEKCNILLYPETISNHHEIVPIMEQTASSKVPLLIIAENVINEALETLLLNVQKGIVNIAAVKIPGIKEQGINILKDIATKTGGEIISPARGLSLSNVAVGNLGVADKVIITNDYTRIIGGEGNQEKIKKRVKQIDEILNSTSSIYETEKYQDRLAMLIGATAIISVGGLTPQEIDENFYGFQSALNSSISAISYGTITGGTTPFLFAQDRLAKIYSKNEGEALGIESIRKSLEFPISCLISNSNFIPNQVKKKIRDLNSLSMGFNAENGNIEDLSDAGIMDPSEVIMKALQVALSHSTMFLETIMWADQKSSEQRTIGFETKS